MDAEVRRVAVLAAVDAADAGGFLACARLAGALSVETWGDDEQSYSPAEYVAWLTDDEYGAHALFGAFEAGSAESGPPGRARVPDAVGYAIAWHQPDSRSVELVVGVRADRRRRGIGSALLAAAEGFGTAAGRSIRAGYSEHAGAEAALGGELLHPPDGGAALPAAAPAAAFATAHGYRLAQLDRVSALAVAGRGAEFAAAARRHADRAVAAGYRLARWADAAPEALLDSYGRARTRMSLDIPAGGLVVDEEHWDAARVRADEAEAAAAGTRRLVAVALADDGEVAGYTILDLPAGRRVAHQADTLVMPEHRGHGLGMLVKLANLERLTTLAPERTRVITWNADENAHMLAINVALGFRMLGLEAAWQRGG